MFLSGPGGSGKTKVINAVMAYAKGFCKELNYMFDKKPLFYRQSEDKPTTLVGETIGDSVKDTSGSSLNILIKMMSMLSLVFAGLFVRTSFLANWMDINKFN